MDIETRIFVVHLPQYFQVEEDFTGTARLMEILCTIYGLPSRLADQERGRQQYASLQNIVTGTSEVAGLLERLEERYDRENQGGGASTIPLSPKVEEFLQGLGQDLGSSVDLDPDSDEAELVARAKTEPGLDGRDLVADVSCSEPYSWTEGLWQGVSGQVPRAARPSPAYRVVAYDFGVKRNILRQLVAHGFDVTVVPARTSWQDALAYEPDAIFLSNGPGDPAAVEGVQETVRELAARKPLFGICLGHQILGLALGGKTIKLKFGHHGGNQPGQDLSTGKVAICAENHGYAVDADSLRKAGEPVEITHVNLNDGTVEGLAHTQRPLFSVQYHPEASPGPHDAGYLFGRFREMVARHKAGETVTGAAVASGRPAPVS
ncbi:MAG: carbamoyl phosphate synthase small subunit [Myxococcales bacterium]|nr:carbamoyl phosphate synthase small subunit [Myxococcales bacterium]